MIAFRKYLLQFLWVRFYPTLNISINPIFIWRIQVAISCQPLDNEWCSTLFLTLWCSSTTTEITTLKNMSQLGWLFPTCGKIKHVPTTNQYSIFHFLNHPFWGTPMAVATPRKSAAVPSQGSDLQRPSFLLAGQHFTLGYMLSPSSCKRYLLQMVDIIHP